MTDEQTAEQASRVADERDLDSDTAPNDDGDAEADGAGVFSRRTLSDLFVNAVPIAMLAAFVIGFGVLAPGGFDSEPLLGFHGALVAGVVLVSYVAVRAVSAADGDLDGDRQVSLYDEREDDDTGACSTEECENSDTSLLRHGDDDTSE